LYPIGLIVKINGLVDLFGCNGRFGVIGLDLFSFVGLINCISLSSISGISGFISQISLIGLSVSGISGISGHCGHYGLVSSIGLNVINGRIGHLCGSIPSKQSDIPTVSISFSYQLQYLTQLKGFLLDRKVMGKQWNCDWSSAAFLCVYYKHYHQFLCAIQNERAVIQKQYRVGCLKRILVGQESNGEAVDL
jgi:hypothetical protein